MPDPDGSPSDGESPVWDEAFHKWKYVTPGGSVPDPLTIGTINVTDAFNAPLVGCRASFGNFPDGDWYQVGSIATNLSAYLANISFDTASIVDLDHGFLTIPSNGYYRIDVAAGLQLVEGGALALPDYLTLTVTSTNESGWADDADKVQQIPVPAVDTWLQASRVAWQVAGDKIRCGFTWSPDGSYAIKGAIQIIKLASSPEPA